VRRAGIHATDPNDRIATVNDGGPLPDGREIVTPMQRLSVQRNGKDTSKQHFCYKT